MKLVMLCGGVGGARAALALYENLARHSLTFLVNTGDDFSHLGLEIWPDWDTVYYHLAGLNDPVRGWGRADEGTRAMEELARFGGPDWFHLGDRDLALHVFRSWALKEGWKRKRIAEHLAKRASLKCTVLPLTEQGTDTRIQTRDGRVMEFQQWFVKEQGGPPVDQVLTRSGAQTPLTEGVLESLREADVLVMAPSNPYLSLGPMLAHPELQAVVQKLEIPRLAVSPLIGGKAVKGPLDRLIGSLSDFRGQQAIAHYWADWVDGLMLPGDEIATVSEPPLKLLEGPTLLSTPAARREFCEALERAWEALR